MVMKYSRASPPTLPTWEAFRTEPMPSTMVQKMIGPIIILIRLTNAGTQDGESGGVLAEDQADGGTGDNGDDDRDVEPVGADLLPLRAWSPCLDRVGGDSWCWSSALLRVRGICFDRSLTFAPVESHVTNTYIRKTEPSRRARPRQESHSPESVGGRDVPRHRCPTLTSVSIYDEPKIDCHNHLLDPAQFPVCAGRPGTTRWRTSRARAAQLIGRCSTLRLAVRPDRRPELRLRHRQPLSAGPSRPQGEAGTRGVAVVDNDIGRAELERLRDRGIVGTTMQAALLGVDALPRHRAAAAGPGRAGDVRRRAGAGRSVGARWRRCWSRPGCGC